MAARRDNCILRVDCITYIVRHTRLAVKPGIIHDFYLSTRASAVLCFFHEDA